MDEAANKKDTDEEDEEEDQGPKPGEKASAEGLSIRDLLNSAVPAKSFSEVRKFETGAWILEFWN